MSEIGWTFDLPQGFDIIDTSTKTVQLMNDKHVWRKQLISKNENAILSISISTMNAEDDQIWDNSYRKEKDHFYETMGAQKPLLKFDSTTSSEIINSEIFTKFTLVGKENGEIVYNHVQLRKLYRKYRFNITYDSTDKNSISKIEKMLHNSKLIK